VRGQLAKGHPWARGGSCNICGGRPGTPPGFGAPGFDGAVGQRERAVGHGEVVINGDDAAEAFCRRTGAERMVEAEQGRGRVAVFDVAFGAMQAVGEAMRGAWCVVRDFQFKIASLPLPKWYACSQASTKRERLVGVSFRRSWTTVINDL